MTHAKKITPLLMFIAVVFGLAMTAKAQDFYGEGNVLIAVDMAAYAENENVDYPEGTMGVLVWGEDAPTGVSTRPAFAGYSYEVPSVVGPLPEPDYELKPAYYVGQTVFFPYVRDEDPDYYGTAWFSADELPADVFTAAGKPNFFISEDCIKSEDGETLYIIHCEQTADGDILPCVDFVELECVAVNEHSTLWQYTGKAISTRTGFEREYYGDNVALTEEETAVFTKTCENAYTVEGRLFGDPHYEDSLGDRDGKAAFVFIGFDGSSSDAYYSNCYTDKYGFDCLVMNAVKMPRDTSITDPESWGTFITNLAHELNHYIVEGCTGHGEWNFSLGELFAQRGADAAVALFPTYRQKAYQINYISSRLRVIAGMLYDTYPLNTGMPYALGTPFLRYIERVSGGGDRLWADYIACRTPDGAFSGEALDAFLLNTTGEGLDSWTAQFMAALVADEDEGPLCFGDEDMRAALHLDRNVFFREAEDYGTKLGFTDENVAADKYVLTDMPASAVQGGGTTYAWRSDEGGKIAVTGADDRWYFFAVTVDLPDPEAVIEISAAEELAKIGNDPAYPLSAAYALTADIDLGGSERPWTPIGVEDKYVHFTGKFDGRDYTVSGLYIADEGKAFQGLFGLIDGGAEIRNLTVRGSVTGGNLVGGVVGLSAGGTVENCVSYVTVTGWNAVGGVVGGAENSVVSGCAGLGTVTGVGNCGGVMGEAVNSVVFGCAGSCPVTGSSVLGGIAGYSENSSFSECRNEGAVTGEDNTGGVIGSMFKDNSVRDCFNTGTVIGNRLVGGIAGDGWDGTITVENCYSYQPDLPAVGEMFEGDAASCYARSDTESGGGYLTTAAFGNQESFEGWDFETVWILDNGLRPLLRNNPEFADVYDGTDPAAPSAPAKEETDVGGVFADVSEEAWYYACVSKAVNIGLMKGVAEGVFEPDGAATRAMAVTMLWRLAGEPEGKPSGFSDVATGSWYEQAVNWAAAVGAVNGTTEKTFSPDESITREQLAAILYRYARSLGKGFTGAWMFLLDYTDADQISGYAYEAMCWMSMHGIINGMGDGAAAPKAEANRAQLAAVFIRFSEDISE